MKSLIQFKCFVNQQKRLLSDALEVVVSMCFNSDHSATRLKYASSYISCLSELIKLFILLSDRCARAWFEQKTLIGNQPNVLIESGRLAGFFIIIFWCFPSLELD